LTPFGEDQPGSPTQLQARASPGSVLIWAFKYLNT